MAHSCAHLRNWFLWWNVSEAGLGRAERDIYPEWLLPVPPPPPRPSALWRAPWVPNRQLNPAQPGPVVKRNDSICALFKFDVFIMHYTIRLIWQFPLYLIKYLCRPEDGSSYQRRRICSTDGDPGLQRDGHHSAQAGQNCRQTQTRLLEMRVCDVKNVISEVM